MRDRHDTSRASFFGENLIESDVAIRDPKGRLQVAIEIKGSMDKAGAQTPDSEGLEIRCPVRKSGQKDNCCHMKM
jgi:hypothetical protein